MGPMKLAHRQFVIYCVNMLSERYHKNSMLLNQIFLDKNISTKSYEQFVLDYHGNTRINAIIREQIKLNEMIAIGKEMTQA